ncbi:hypothetical protein HK096_003395 [Nowakowskiella sp. JEL0078]|nr:hypothetical protein HK096_003395 [Nowakowskiella sp. JEL0078]
MGEGHDSTPRDAFLDSAAQSATPRNTHHCCKSKASTPQSLQNSTTANVLLTFTGLNVRLMDQRFVSSGEPLLEDTEILVSLEQSSEATCHQSLLVPALEL